LDCITIKGKKKACVISSECARTLSLIDLWFDVTHERTDFQPGDDGIASSRQ